MLEAKEFMNVAKMILSGNPEGKKYLQNMVNEIIKEIKSQEYEQAIGGDDEDNDGGDDDSDDDGDLDDFLSGLGIHTS
jgi:hypothetical protein